MLAVAAVTAAVAGCSPTGPARPVASTNAPAGAQSTSAATEPRDPEGAAEPPALIAEGTAADNLPLFAAVTAAVWASEERGAGRAYIDALVQAGFEKAAMEVTHDLTTVGNPAESIQFSVMWGQECLLGQVGPATGEPVTTIMPVLQEGTCLVGQTRVIDW